MDIDNWLDDATAALALQLQIQDVAELSSTSKGKSREGEHSDAELAISIYESELEERNTVLADHRLARSLTRAVLSDEAIITESLTAENVATRDRALAQNLAGAANPFAANTTADDKVDDSLIARLTALYVSGRNSDDDNLEDASQADDTAGEESSAWAVARARPSTTTHHQCTSCDTETPNHKVCRTPCGHYYCQRCLHTLFELSTTDETLFPPRCCRQAIPLNSARLYLDPTLICTFEHKSIEFKSSDRTYCSNPRCSSFITSMNIEGEQATCTACGTATCTICKGNAHTGDCPEDTAIQQVLETAREEGWQRCYNCRRLVELDVGCNHMTYDSRYRLWRYLLTSVVAVLAVHNSGTPPFLCQCYPTDIESYVCGERWKTCPCDQWNEDRLVARANQVVARDLPRAGEVREQQVNQAIEHLRNRHNCDHTNWRYVPGPHQCEECYHNLPHYIFECRQCRILACNRCRRNRF